jgi:hypothetical protein
MGVDLPHRPFVWLLRSIRAPTFEQQAVVCCHCSVVVLSDALRILQLLFVVVEHSPRPGDRFRRNPCAANILRWNWLPIGGFAPVHIGTIAATVSATMPSPCEISTCSNIKPILCNLPIRVLFLLCVHEPPFLSCGCRGCRDLSDPRSLLQTCKYWCCCLL